MVPAGRVRQSCTPPDEPQGVSLQEQRRDESGGGQEIGANERTRMELLGAQGNDGVDSAGASGRDPRRQERHAEENERHGDERGRIPCLDPKQEAGHEPSQPKADTSPMATPTTARRMP